VEIAIRQNPSAGNYEELGLLRLDKHDWAGARACFDHALAQRTDSLDPFYRRGLAEVQLGDFTAARADLERVVTADASYDFQRAAGLLAYADWKTGDLDRAQRLFEQVLRTSTLTETQLHYAEFLAANNRREEAKQQALHIRDKRAAMPGFQRRSERKLFWQNSALLRKL
jgi:tetratricopeptide (TPR) repeat protein